MTLNFASIRVKYDEEMISDEELIKQEERFKKGYRKIKQNRLNILNSCSNELNYIIFLQAELELLFLNPYLLSFLMVLFVM